MPHGGWVNDLPTQFFLAVHRDTDRRVIAT